MISLPTFRGVLAKGSSFDPDAAAYFARITTAGSSITTANKSAVNAFITGCKADGIWPAIKASCLLAGPDSLAGALVPLVGTAPTNVNFVSGDYSRTTGLVGDGTTKYLDSNRNNNADPQNSKHLAVWRTQSETLDITRAAIGMASTTGQSNLFTNATSRIYRIHDTGGIIADTSTITGLWGASRSSSTTKTGRYNNTNTTISTVSAIPASANLQVFARNGADFSNARMSFYSIGEAIDLALLDARLTTYMASLT